MKKENILKSFKPHSEEVTAHGGSIGRALNSGLEGPGFKAGLAFETQPYTLIAPCACKIRHGCKILQVPIQIMFLGAIKRGSHPLCGRSKL